mmetsp:Transcript_17896/g.37462  ORF Transcript_17896/g.37462 Transcript_17896/m.37462 type:complete len:217 (+) Transcript_17896:1102-1752(+)
MGKTRPRVPIGSFRGAHQVQGRHSVSKRACRFTNRRTAHGPGTPNFRDYRSGTLGLCWERQRRRRTWFRSPLSGGRYPLCPLFGGCLSLFQEQQVPPTDFRGPKNSGARHIRNARILLRWLHARETRIVDWLVRRITQRHGQDSQSAVVVVVVTNSVREAGRCSYSCDNAKIGWGRGRSRHAGPPFPAACPQPQAMVGTPRAAPMDLSESIVSPGR